MSYALCGSLGGDLLLVVASILTAPVEHFLDSHSTGGRHDLRRIAVVDFDGHRGAGTEALLAGDDNFLYIGLHPESVTEQG